MILIDFEIKSDNNLNADRILKNLQFLKNINDISKENNLLFSKIILVLNKFDLSSPKFQKELNSYSEKSKILLKK